MTDELLAVKIRTLEVQLTVLKAQLQRTRLPMPQRTFAELYGMLAGKVSSDEEEIEAAQFQFEWEGREER